MMISSLFTDFDGFKFLKPLFVAARTTRGNFPTNESIGGNH